MASSPLVRDSQSGSMSLWMSAPLPLLVYLFDCLRVYMFLSGYVYLSVCLSVCLSVHMSVCLSVRLLCLSIRLLGPGFEPRLGQKFETRFPLHSHPSGGEGVSPVQGEAIRRRYIKTENSILFCFVYLSVFPAVCLYVCPTKMPILCLSFHLTICLLLTVPTVSPSISYLILSVCPPFLSPTSPYLRHPPLPPSRWGWWWWAGVGRSIASDAPPMAHCFRGAARQTIALINVN